MPGNVAVLSDMKLRQSVAPIDVSIMAIEFVSMCGRGVTPRSMHAA
jgi:hypothetical protein